MTDNAGRLFVGGDFTLAGTTVSPFIAQANLLDPPEVATLAPSGLTATGVTLRGTVNPNGLTSTARFDYGLTISYGSTAGVTLSPDNGSTAQNVSAAVSGLAPNTLYHYRLTATNAMGTSVTVNGTFTTQTHYQAWAAASGLTGAESGSSDDYDHDGVSNLLEWAFGTDPGVSDGGLLAVSGGTITQRGAPTVRVENIPNGVDFRAVFGRRRDHLAVGLTYAVQFSADLATWQTSAATPVVIAADGEIEAVTVPYPFFINGRKVRFFRVTVTGP